MNWIDSVHHDGSGLYVLPNILTLGDTARIRLRVQSGAPIRGVYLRSRPDGEQLLTKMVLIAEDGPSVWWEARLEIREPRIRYRFVIITDKGVLHFGAAGISEFEASESTDFQILADFRPLPWLDDAVFYQIFPDTFADGDASNNPEPRDFEYQGHRPRTYPWGSVLPQGAPYSQSYYGGDLAGIVGKLDYLHTLGVNALYLNPVFTAYSCHRYDTVDYGHVDPILGGDAALASLRTALDERGMRYILDLVPNHCGMAHPWFLNAQSDATAMENGFFTFTSHPDRYIHWGQYPNLVKLNYVNPELRRRMYAAPDSILRRWLRPPYGADGWRVDVGNMLGRQGAIQLNGEILREMRKALKEEKADAYFMGENFYEAADQLQGDQWDGVMNYHGFNIPLLNWTLGIQPEGDRSGPTYPFSTAALCSAWKDHLARIPWGVALQQFNLLDSHDTRRLGSLVDGDLHRMLATVQFTFPGIPCLYYGDEIGMADLPGATPMGGSSRACMVWEESRWDRDLLEFYKSLIALRKKSLALRRGAFQILTVREDCIAYQREYPDERIIVVACRKDSDGSIQIPAKVGGFRVGSCFTEQFSGITGEVDSLELHLPKQARGASVWVEHL